MGGPSEATGRAVRVAHKPSPRLHFPHAAQLQEPSRHVQFPHRTAARLNFEDLARHLETLGDVSYNRFLLKFAADGYDFTVFPDGRAIIKGTSDVDKARTLYAKYIGH